MLVESETDPWQSVTVLPDGNSRLTAGVDAERAPDPADVDGDGTSWREVDATLIAQPVDGRIGMVAAPVDLTFSAGGSADGPLASLTTPDGHTVAVDTPFAIPEAIIDPDGGQVLYPLGQGVDLVVTPNADGTSFSEVIRAESADALAAVPELDGLTDGGLVFPVSVSDGLDVRSDEAGGFTVVEVATARTVAELPAPVAWDSAADAVLEAAPDDALAEGGSVAGGSAAATEAGAQTADAEAAGTDMVVAPDGEVIEAGRLDERRAAAPVAGDSTVALGAELVEASDGDAGIRVAVDGADLAAMDGVLHIDPNIGTKKPGGKAVIQSAFPSTTHYNDATSFPLGACTATIGCPTTNVVRSAFQWTGLTAIKNLKSSDVVSATFTVFGYHSYACSSRPVQVWRTAAIGSSTTWNNFAGSSKWHAKLGEKNIHHKDNYCNNARNIAWDVKPAAKWAASNNSARITLGMKGTSTSDVYSWKRYSNPRLEIVYNRAPKVPRASEMKLEFEGQAPEACSTSGTGAPAFSSKTGIVMRGVARDQDSPQVRVKFRVRTSGGTSVYYTENWSGWKTPPATFTRTIPSSTFSSTSGVYYWQMIVQDQLDGSPARNTTFNQSPKCYFKVDTSRPATPSVTSNQYPAGEISGGVGQSGTFTFDSNSGDVVTYRYSLDSDGLGSSKSPSTPGGPVSVTLPMNREGSHLLYVQAVDGAGNTSDVRHHRFTVDFPTTAAYWHLDEYGYTSEGTRTTPDAGALGHTLKVGATIARVPGPFALAGLRTEDLALEFDADETTWGATGVTNAFGCSDDTTGPDGVPDGRTEDLGNGASACVDRTVDDFEAGFTVSAFVRPDVSTSTSTMMAVSQEGTNRASFHLGVFAGEHCPEDESGVQPGACWGIGMYSADAGGGTTTQSRAFSLRPIVAGEWVHLTGVFNATEEEMSLFVCPMGTDPDPRNDPPDAWFPVVDAEHGTAEYAGSRWAADRAVRLGRSMYGGEAAYRWLGAVDEVRLYNAPLGNGQITRICSGDITSEQPFAPGAEREDGDGDDSVVGDPNEIPMGEGDGDA
ncbi:LamG-like jellyroll fold domain-containing protein [Myceligenerans xiligouense]|uniref:Concanavalin A-like lectin/glucanase superfamily protein n=1 Tax=Myceligenerans xiligouense TaxID=253184 RepID=A0A3N4Z619_9MICO|nr:LamG-like jellyroll fold domain-containing protein [Myceligenerans xiligouense]RPF20712.1 concanavalin A-like lectin/glucanase superfamily protein [Myceligenerans xiligouense]